MLSGRGEDMLNMCVYVADDLLFYFFSNALFFLLAKLKVPTGMNWAASRAVYCVNVFKVFHESQAERVYEYDTCTHLYRRPPFSESIFTPVPPGVKNFNCFFTLKLAGDLTA